MKEKVTSGREQLNQLWMINYLSGGYYCIRPLYNMNMALHSTSGNVDITTIGASNSSVPGASKWTIEYGSNAYLFKYVGTNSLTMRCAVPYKDALIITEPYASTTTDFNWILERVTSVSNQLLLLDFYSGKSVAGSTICIDPGAKVSLSDLHIATSFVCPISIDQSITWSVHNPSVLTLNDETGEIKPLTPGGTTSIVAKHIHMGVAYEASVTVYVQPVPNGTYYLRSQAYNKYMQNDKDDAPTGYTTSGAIIEQWEYDGGEYQQWTLWCRENGYYSIISAISGKAISVPLGQEHSADVSLVQETYTGADRQLWKITPTDKGYYIIKAKSAEGASDDLVMSVGYGLLNDSDGVNIEQRIYDEHTEEYWQHKDKWYICSKVDIGMSTDNYTGGGDRERQSYFYGSKFWEGLDNGNPFTLTHHYNKDDVTTASKLDFAVNGAMSNDIDFMIYIGHGHSTNCTNNANGNHIQYSYAPNGLIQYSDVCEVEFYGPDLIDMFCVYTDEVEFGSSESDLRWVWMYTCNFLNTTQDADNDDDDPDNNHSNVTEEELVKMMKGAHIVMGNASRTTLADAMATTFSTLLSDGIPIYDAYFRAGYMGEGKIEQKRHYQKILYIPQARYETIYSPAIHYEYDPSDVRIDKRCIKDAY